MATPLHTLEDIEALEKDLELIPELQPEHERVTTRQAIERLMPKIRLMQAHGKLSIERIAAILSERGLVIKASTLRGYLQKSTSRAKGRRAKRSATGAAGGPMSPAGGERGTGAAAGSGPAGAPAPNANGSRAARGPAPPAGAAAPAAK
jgi:hypothetical protein